MRDVRTGHVTEVLFLSPVTLSESIFVTVRFPKYGSRRFGTTNLQSQNATDQRDLFSVSVSTELRATQSPIWRLVQMDSCSAVTRTGEDRFGCRIIGQTHYWWPEPARQANRTGLISGMARFTFKGEMIQKKPGHALV